MADRKRDKYGLYNFAVGGVPRSQQQSVKMSARRPKQFVPQGGMWNTPKATYSKETQQLLKSKAVSTTIDYCIKQSRFMFTIGCSGVCIVLDNDTSESVNAIAV